MGFKCGIVGLPNVGKSTLFIALTRAGIDAENFPFCTIEPNAGVVPVPDPVLLASSAVTAPGSGGWGPGRSCWSSSSDPVVDPG